jgi:hypothetical protein
MKKVIPTLAMAAAVTFAACSGNNNANSNSAANNSSDVKCELPVAVDASVKLDKTFDHAKFSLSYPGIITVQEMLGSDFYAADSEGLITISGTFNTEGVAVSELGSFAENMAVAIKAAGDTPETPIVKGNSYVIKCDAGNLVKWSYCVMKEDKISLMGEITYPKEKAAECEKYVGAFLSSIKFK